MLLTRIPAGSTSSISLVPLRQEDYPHVRFWTRQDWNSVAQAQVLELDEEGENFPEADEEEDKLDPLPPSPNPACARGKRRASQGINVTMKYIENEDGTVYSTSRSLCASQYRRSRSHPSCLHQAGPCYFRCIHVCIWFHRQENPCIDIELQQPQLGNRVHDRL